MRSKLNPNHPESPTRRISFREGDFERSDETDDRLFYSRDRFVQHLDDVALSTVEKLIGELIIGENPVILDLMAGWDSHIPEKLRPSKVVGLGLNENELTLNKDLSEYVIHDLNKDPQLPFPDDHFDSVINTVSVDYMTRPIEVFKDVRRVLKPGGLFLVIFSNRYFPPKVVKIWRKSSEEERIILVEEFFRASGGFEGPQRFISKGRPRPKYDRYAHLELPSDPIYAIYADKAGGNPARKPRPTVKLGYGERLGQEDLKNKMETIKETLCCPYCGEKMSKWAVSQTPFTEWDNEFMYICFNDACPYLVRGWEAMEKQGNMGISYRCMYNPLKDRCTPVPVPTLDALKDGIID
jgi:SAM-dependent methyltransferase